MFQNILLFCILTLTCAAETIDLWPDQVPAQSEEKAAHGVKTLKDGSTRINKVTNPSIEVFRPAENIRNEIAIIVCPGGAYKHLADEHEGRQVSTFYQQLGYTTFTLLYRVPNQRDAALHDIQRAIRYVRSNASKFNIDPNKIGILGFSAGGHLCVRAATAPHPSYPSQDTVDTSSPHPNFVAAIYPAYIDSGPNKTLSAELKISKDTPPMFIAAARDDFTFVNGSLVLASALAAQQHPYELHLFSQGKHGFGMRPGTRVTASWPTLCHQWISELYAK